MLKIALVEDNDREAREVLGFIRKYSESDGENIDVTRFSDAVKFLADYASDYDIVFMDIEMPQLNGMDAARKLRKIDQSVVLVFITNMVQFAVNGYEVGAYDFIVKPVSYENFKMKFERILNKHRADFRGRDELVLPCKTGVKRISVSSLKYVEVIGHRLVFHTFDGDTEISGNLSDWESRLKGYNFSRCNNCYLVNLKYVGEVNATSAVVGAEQLLISRRRRQNFIDDLTVFLGES